LTTRDRPMRGGRGNLRGSTPIKLHHGRSGTAKFGNTPLTIPLKSLSASISLALHVYSLVMATNRDSLQWFRV
ncbi:hypothetical protein J6590_093883, partial [Homalodisca vitripennis]